MALPTTETVDCDVLIIGGGMSGCGAAFEAKYWSGDSRVVMVEKAAIERSGATGEGLSAINCYMGQRFGWNTPEDFVRYVVNDMMGLAREDLVYDVGRHVDNSVHLLEEWGSAHLEAGKRRIRTHRPVADTDPRRVHQAHRRRAGPHGARA